MARKRRRVDSSTVQPDDPDEQDESDATLPEPHATRKKPATFERFFELPTEVRDMVYEYVYHVPEEERMTNVVVRDEWEYREKIRQQRSAIPLPVSTPVPSTEKVCMSNIDIRSRSNFRNRH